jgi:hypothetical protein
LSKSNISKKTAEADGKSGRSRRYIPPKVWVVYSAVFTFTAVRTRNPALKVVFAGYVQLVKIK